MASSINYISPVDSDSVVLVTKEKNWTNIKIYANGGLQYSSGDGDELKLGIFKDVDGFGKIEMHLKTDLEITVNGTPYTMISKDAEEKVTNVSSIFWVLTIFSAIGFVLLLLLSSRFLVGNEFILFMAMQLFAILIYGATAILLSRGFYWFYFIGASVYTFFSALILIDIEEQFSSFGDIAAFIIRFFLLAMVLRIIPIILKQMRNSKPTGEGVLDQ